MQEQQNEIWREQAGCLATLLDPGERLHGFFRQYIAHTPEKLSHYVVFRPFDLVTILFIAVSHGDALHPSFSH